ncbi:MAG: hypothetical protein ACJASM_000744 [Salibacteraceae bacterium]
MIFKNHQKRRNSLTNQTHKKSNVYLPLKETAIGNYVFFISLFGEKVYAVLDSKEDRQQ